MNNTQIRGIAARFKGTCPICRREWQAGDIIDKIPNTDPPQRGHAQCVANLARSAGQATTPQAQPPAQAAPVATGTIAPSFPIDPAIITELWRLKDALTTVASGAMAAAVAVEAIARSVDPHQSKAPHKEHAA